MGEVFVFVYVEFGGGWSKRAGKETRGQRNREYDRLSRAKGKEIERVLVVVFGSLDENFSKSGPPAKGEPRKMERGQENQGKIRVDVTRGKFFETAPRL